MILSVFGSMLSSSLALAGPAEFAAPPQPATAPTITSSDGALALERVRPRSRRGSAALAFAASGGAFAGLIATQISRAVDARDCARRLDEEAADLGEALGTVFGCSVTAYAPARMGAAAVLAPLSVAMAGLGGLVLGRADARLGTAIPRARIERRIKFGAAVLGTFAGIVVTLTPALWRLSMEHLFEPTGLRLQQAQYIVTDVGVIGAAVGAVVLARARQYQLARPTITVAPTLSAQGGAGLSIAGRF
jgi:hypothetical protein